jgi:small subunit ribosomal protein S17e
VVPTESAELRPDSLAPLAAKQSVLDGISVLAVTKRPLRTHPSSVKGCVVEADPTRERAVYEARHGERRMAIKPAYVKKTATELLERYPEAFSGDFEHNKESVTALTDIDSKNVRNRIAGYIARKQRAPPA